jgi:hypothetical protein
VGAFLQAATARTANETQTKNAVFLMFLLR